MTDNNTRQSLGIDIGGTGIKVAAVDTVNGRLLTSPIYRPTHPATPSAIASAIKEIVEEIRWHGPIGCGYPGVVQNGIARTAVHLSKEWIDQDVSRILGIAVGTPVAVINDADAAGIAEMKFGAGRGHQNRGVVLLLTFGTGIGSALFVNGLLVPNTELGHVFIEGVGAEELAAASRRTTENLSWENWGARVNRYLAEMEKLFSPDLLVLGGGVSENFAQFAPYLNTRAALLPALLGNEAGIVGASLVAVELNR
jgi:polyphosphate glucokinase